MKLNAEEKAIISNDFPDKFTAQGPRIHRPHKKEVREKKKQLSPYIRRYSNENRLTRFFKAAAAAAKQRETFVCGLRFRAKKAV